MKRASLTLLAFVAIAPTFGKPPAPTVTFVSPCECIGFQGKNRWVSETDFIACPAGYVRDSIGHTIADLRMGGACAGCGINQHDRENASGAKMVCTHRAYR
jgi:hypothetical protein